MTRTVDLQHTAERARGDAVMVTILVTLTIGPGVNASEESPLPIDEAAERAFRETIGERFAVQRTDHFVIFHNVDPVMASHYQRCMETAYHRVRRFCQVHGLQVSRPPRKMEAFCTWEVGLVYRLELPSVAYAEGVYDLGTKRCYFDFWERRDRHCGFFMHRWFFESELLIVAHESAHQVFDHLCPNLSKNMPAWLAEGLACAMEHGATSDKDGYQKINRLRALDVLRMLDSDAWPRVRDKELDEKISVVEVLSHTRALRNDGTGGTVEVRQALRYAVAWAVVFYLQNEKPEGFRKLLHALNAPTFKRDQLQQSIEGTIGPIDEDFEKRVWKYLRRACR
ncbi:MAG: DUF1570 domain-containing protein [Phycisphaerae bacterium]